ncbi:aminotransferase class-V family protein [Clostridioides difficile CD17]|nr:aminotransferase class V-fold PLP-dependent enzyme [Clostridioides difficile]EQE23846.1 aminotransferase class-V family protein [Clostridioides difficile CD17]
MEIYLDNSATTKPYQEVIDKMVYALNTEYGNPSSVIEKV